LTTQIKTTTTLQQTITIYNKLLIHNYSAMSAPKEEDNPTTTPEEDPKIAKQKDVEAQMKIVDKMIRSLCTEDSEFDDLKVMGAELKDGDTLDITSITGGLTTNYSFKVSTTKKTTVYAKICFEFALWNPNKTVKYNLTRVQNEFDMIKDVSTFDPCPVITPYHCVDVVDDANNKMKLLVTAWSKADEQVCHALNIVVFDVTAILTFYLGYFVHSSIFLQFANHGQVDDRILDKLATFLSQIITSPFDDPSFNEDCRPCLN
jgi:hypothetical protein